MKPGKTGKRKYSKAEKKQKRFEEKRLKSKLAKKNGPTAPSSSTSASNGNDFGSKMAKAAAKVGAKPVKPVFNAEGKMVFSKFDFTDDRGFKTDDAEHKKQALDPKSALAKLQKHKEKLKSLESEGKVFSFVMFSKIYCYMLQCGRIMSQICFVAKRLSGKFSIKE
jgi:hypothetical protein